MLITREKILLCTKIPRNKEKSHREIKLRYRESADYGRYNLMLLAKRPLRFYIEGIKIFNRKPARASEQNPQCV